MTKDRADAVTGRPEAGSTEEVLAAFELVRQRTGGLHMPEFLGIDITMSQAKILLLLVSLRELHMSTLASRLGLSISTVSGHVDRLVEQGLVARRDDPADRRQVLVAPTASAIETAERFRELNASQLRQVVDLMTPAERRDVALAFGHIARALDRLVSSSAGPSDASTPRPCSKG